MVETNEKVVEFIQRYLMIYPPIVILKICNDYNKIKKEGLVQNTSPLSF